MSTEMKNKNEFTATKYIKERTKILKRLDNISDADIIEFANKYVSLKISVESMRAGLHKARLYVTDEDITERMKEDSKRWLAEHDMSVNIF